MRPSAIMLGSILIGSCQETPRENRASVTVKQPVEVIDAVWTEAAAERADRLSDHKLKLGKDSFELPLVRAYNSKRGLVFALPEDWKSATLGEDLDEAIGSHWEIDGVSFAQAVAEVELRDGTPLSVVIATSDAPVIFDYWTDWCVRCRGIEEKLIDWAASSENGPVRIVKVEANPLRLSEARGDRILFKRQPDGKLSKRVLN